MKPSPNDKWLAFNFDGEFMAGGATRREALKAVAEAPVLRLHRYAPGDYEYITGFPGEDHTKTFYIVTWSEARRMGWLKREE